MATQLEIYNLALLQMKQSKLADLTEDIEARYVLDDLYDFVLKEMVEKGYWVFAMRTVQITQDEAITPAFGYSQAFNMPEDWVKTWGVSLSERMEPLHEDWIEESNLLFADAGPLYLRYVSNHTSGYGYDGDRWTGRFIRAFAFELAYRAAPKVAGSSDAFNKKLEGDAIRAVNEALQFEAHREPVRSLPQGRWNGARFNGGSGGRWLGGPYRSR